MDEARQVLERELLRCAKGGATRQGRLLALKELWDQKYSHRVPPYPARPSLAQHRHATTKAEIAQVWKVIEQEKVQVERTSAEWKQIKSQQSPDLFVSTQVVSKSLYVFTLKDETMHACMHACICVYVCMHACMYMCVCMHA